METITAEQADKIIELLRYIGVSAGLGVGIGFFNLIAKLYNNVTQQTMLEFTGGIKIGTDRIKIDTEQIRKDAMEIKSAFDGELFISKLNKILDRIKGV